MANVNPSHEHTGTEPIGPGNADALDAANLALVEGLHKSFWVLKAIMVVLVVLYALSGWFSVKPNEVGIITRFGSVAGGPTGEILRPGWHWSWPYPIEGHQRVSVSERELPIQFIEKRTDEEEISGKLGYKFNDRLSPDRDDYLVTGDANILHSLLKVKYRITDPIAYVNHVKPMPKPDASVTSGPLHEHFAEYSILSNLTRDAVIEISVAWKALEIRGSRQNEFLGEVAVCVIRKLNELKAAGTPLGITVDPVTGIVAPKTAGNEGVYPPRQVQKDFDEVFATQTRKAQEIAKAEADAEELLTQAAGAAHPAISKAIDKEFRAMLAVSKAEGHGNTDDIELAGLRNSLEEKRAEVENMILAASGQVRAIIRMSQVYKDAIEKEAIADWKKIEALLPEYRRNPDILFARLGAENYAVALANDKLTKWWLYPGNEVRIKIQDSPRKPDDETDRDPTFRRKVTIDQDEVDLKGILPRSTALRQ
ncbi:MAG: SPFH domain-containing protein [Planctomycetota bacterium]|nr:SPFH domain-containing protein [Planctomycetota bacterium]